MCGEDLSSQRMLDLCDKNCERNSATIDTCIAGSGSTWGFCDSQGQESTLSRNLNIQMTNSVEYYQTSEQLGVHFQEQDSSSTQSTGQSHPDVTSIETKAYGQNILSSGLTFFFSYISSAKYMLKCLTMKTMSQI